MKVDQRTRHRQLHPVIACDVGDGVPGERQHSTETDTAGYEIGGTGVSVSFGQETRKDTCPLVLAEIEVVRCGETDRIDQGVDSAKAIEVALLERPGSRLRPTESDGASVAELFRLGRSQRQSGAGRSNRAIEPGTGKSIIDLAAVAEVGLGLGAERPDRELPQPREGLGEARVVL